MPIELRVPEMGESITEVQIGQWLKTLGDLVQKDDLIVEIESDKATVDLPSPARGKLTEILKQSGEAATVGETIAFMEPVAAGEAANDPESAHAAAAETAVSRPAGPTTAGDRRVMPAAQRVLAEHNLSAGDVQATGPGGRLLKEDVLRHVSSAPMPEAETPAPAAVPMDGRQEDVVPMSPLRKTIAARLVEAQQTAALLTTFNEIDLSDVISLRKQHRETFQQKHGVKLGFMSFFVKATIEALKLVPGLNAEIRDEAVVYRNYFDVGVAVSGRKGLLVPVLRDAERMSFAEIEMAIADFGRRAQENKITLAELLGGTFTISNGGVFGSLLSTPIINPPQSGILGMHTIQDRPVARDGQVVIRPMMYVALTYDHRVVDGREAVAFLLHVKNLIEQPARMLIEV